MTGGPAADSAVTLVWHPEEGLRRAAPAGPGKLLAADSWLLEDGTVRGFGLHEHRFRAACAGTRRVPVAEVDRFWQAVRRELPRTGVWFPRVELLGGADGASLVLRVRPAPRRTADARVWVGGADPRLHPRRKGPDLDRLAELRRRAADAGGDEALLTTRAGFVLEAANSGLLWWEGDDLCLADPRLRVLPSVTVALIRRAAGAHGIAVREWRCRLTDLGGCEVWLVNALHGIRPVVAWLGADVRPGPAVRAEAWRDWWAGGAGAAEDVAVGAIRGVPLPT